MTEQVRAIRLRPTLSTVLDSATNSDGEIFFDSNNQTLRIFDNGTGALVATRTWTTSSISTAIAAIPAVDLTGLATETYVDDAISAIPAVDFTGLATETFVGTAIGQKASLTDISVDTVIVTQTFGSLSYNNTTGVFTFTPPDETAILTNSSGFGVQAATVATSGSYNDLTDKPTLVTKDYVDANDLVATVGALRHTLDNPNAYGTSVFDQFSWSVAIDGNYAIVGVRQEDDAGGDNSGKAYIFDVTTGALVHTLDNPTAYSTSAGDLFGQSVAISGDRAIVGAYFEDDAGGNNSGKAYIFDVITGALVHTLDNPTAYSTSAGDLFGGSVAISGNYAIVGAHYENDAGGNTSGKAYIFDVTSGALVHTLDNPNAFGTSFLDQFGWSVAISGNYAIVGTWYEGDAGGNNSGKAYIFDVTTGALLFTLDNPNAYGTSANDQFGESVAISGNYAIVSARQEDDAGGDNSGKAYIFDVTTGALVHTLDNPTAYSTSDNDNFGTSVAISGNYAIVGAYFEDDAGGNTSGKAYIFNVITGALLYTLDNPNAYSTSAGDNFGRSVAIDGNYTIVGACQEGDAGGGQSGKAYVFEIKAEVDSSLNVTGSLTTNGTTTLQQTTEVLNTKTAATGTVVHDFSTGAVFYHSNISADFTANFTNVPTTNDRTISVVLILNQGATAYLPTAVQIGGAVQTIQWQGNIPPTGTVNGVDIISFTFVRTGSAWTVLGSRTSYS